MYEARKRETSLERYGVEDATHTPEVRAKREATNFERYGASNPFSKESSLFSKVMTSLEGRRPVLRGVDNPFAWDDVREKIQATWKARHGVTNPQQVEDIRARTRATNYERYGGELMGSAILAEKARQTNLERHGDAFPQRTEAVKSRQRETNVERYGVPWTSMDLDVRRKQLETMEAKWDSHFWASGEGKMRVRAAMLAKWGVPHALQDPEMCRRAIHNMVATKMRRYGSPWGPRSEDGPNGLERTVASLAPANIMEFTGDGSFWRKLPLLGRHKNPDFVMRGPDRKVVKVVEVFGDFWHSKMRTGKAPSEHAQELVDAYADVGIECLVIWGSEVRASPDDVRVRLVRFLGVSEEQDRLVRVDGS